MSEKKKIIAGVVGDPISHSLSPRLHGYWLQKYEIDGEYKAFHVVPDDLHDFVGQLKENDISGLNITVPHKETVMSLVDEIDERARKIGAVNTVCFNRQGNLVGSNTDGYGFLKHLKKSAPNWQAEMGPAVIIGAGGAARAVIVSLLEDGVPEIRLCNRTIARAENIKHELADSRVKVIKWEGREEALKGANLLVNVTTLGMSGQPGLDLSLENLPKQSIVYDIVYNPLETELIRNARRQGNDTVDGLGMLLHQAVPGFKAWFGIAPEVDDALRAHVLEALK